MPKYVEILGIKESNNGRQCQRHLICGETVSVGSLLLLKPVVVLNQQSQAEYAISAVLMTNGIEDCTVGFLGKEFHFFRNQYEHKLVEIIEVLNHSSNTEHRRRCHVNRGIAVGILIS